MCVLLGIPAATYELAKYQNRLGVITPNLVPLGGRLVFGNELLAKIVPGYDDTKYYRQKENTVRFALAVMKQEMVLPPLRFQGLPGVVSAKDVFVGYLMLDALIANQDRHSENWGLLALPGKLIHLAHTFDHASSLGRNETDAVRLERLATRDRGRNLEHYVEKASSAFYASNQSHRPMATIEVFRESAKINPGAAMSWLNRLTELICEDVAGIFQEIPPEFISDPAIRFASRMLELNRQRLLAIREELQ